jgi:ornithine cyclodeaminase
MPAWRETGIIGTKIASVFPGNAARGQPAVSAVYLVQNGETGAFEALIDGAELTARRTAAASALASKFLSRPESETLLCFGSGKLAPNFVAAHCAVRPLRTVLIAGRTPAKLEAMRQRLSQADGMAGITLAVVAPSDVADAVASADIISCTTMSDKPLFDGHWVRRGTHIDLAGAFRPDLRETDDTLVRRSDIIAVDSRAGALVEGGDLVQAIASGVITADDVAFELSELCRANRTQRADSRQITLFKSVGHALLDYAAAELCMENRKNVAM